ncbi:MAG: hypothetical protein FWH48_08560 [Oscillospiraceae bacterium]|nr:hypothetical protein [Oscillospiraceae bacterium]
MRIKYSCVVDNKAHFQLQGWLWLCSLIQFGKIEPSNIYIHCIVGTPKKILEKFSGTGANVLLIEPFGDKKYCNKIMQLSSEGLVDSDAIVLMDTDMIMLKNFEDTIDENYVSGKIVYFSNPETPTIDALFGLAGLKKTLPDVAIESDGEYFTYGANFNGGLYIIPKDYYAPIKFGWEKWAIWLLENGEPLREAKKEANIDQVGFCMTIHEKNIPIKYLDRRYNYHVLFDLGESCAPYVLHYHAQTDESGCLALDYAPKGAIKEAVEAANGLIKKNIKNFL